MRLDFPRRLRLRNRTVFKQVYEQGRFLSNALISLHYYPRIDGEHRIGFTAGKRLGSAVTRNRCKRRLKECYRLYRDETPSGIDIIVVARKGMVAADWAKIVAAFRELMRRTHHILATKR